MECTEVFEKTLDAYNALDETNKVESIPKYRQIVSMGGSRSSKTYSILQLLLLELCSRTNIKITVWRNAKVTCRTTIMEDFQEILMSDSRFFNSFKENKQYATFTNKYTKSKIVFEGADDVGKVLGSKQTISFFNEVTEFSKEVYLQITQRTSDRIFCDYNPSKNFWLESYRYDKRTIFIHSDFRNNFFCPPNIVEQLLSYEPWEPGSYDVIDSKVYYKGEPVSPINYPPPHHLNIKKGTASIYMWLVYGLGIGSEKPNKIYRGWKEITNDYFDSLKYDSYFGLDFGASNPTACLEVKYDGDSAFYVKKHLYKPLSNIEDSLPTTIKHEVPAMIKGRSLVVCDSAKDAYIDLLLNSGYLAVKATKGGGSVEYGITIVQGFTIYYVSDEQLQFEYDNYSWTVDRYGKSTDVPLKIDDHLMDALRYVITYLVEYLQIKI